MGFFLLNLVMRLFLIFNLIFVSNILISQSITQDVVSSGGETYNQINGSVQLNLGEPMVETYVNPGSPQLYLGFEQGSYSLVSIEENKSISNLTIQVYPNPSKNLFFLNFGNSDFQNFFLSITDNLGKTIVDFSPILSNSTEFDLSTHQRGLYHINVFNNKLDYHKTFSILKQ